MEDHLDDRPPMPARQLESLMVHLCGSAVEGRQAFGPGRAQKCPEAEIPSAPRSASQLRDRPQFRRSKKSRHYYKKAMRIPMEGGRTSTGRHKGPCETAGKRRQMEGDSFCSFWFVSMGGIRTWLVFLHKPELLEYMLF